ncbi:MAG: hypothetical protein BRC53_13325 [Cyanobacteria bacterium SW_6_48_11]|nr:MAG: hypothetical protein BRC53_13325 [Cyanobacteria bacterium SW_6_48_11]
MMSRWRKLLASLVLVGLLLVSSCAREAPSRFGGAQQESTQRGAEAVAKEAVAGSSLNKFFPAAGKGEQLVYTQEKKGFAEAKLKQQDQDLARMSIADITINPSAAQKYRKSTEKVAGYPAVGQGKTGTGVLVSDRFQVKVLSRDSSFSDLDRIAWLEKFDLDGLSKLQ